MFRRTDEALEGSATRLATALAAFAATCREYPLDIDASLADQLRVLDRLIANLDLTVGAQDADEAR